jgi:hypothetical protein
MGPWHTLNMAPDSCYLRSNRWTGASEAPPGPQEEKCDVQEPWEPSQVCTRAVAPPLRLESQAPATDLRGLWDT